MIKIKDNIINEIENSNSIQGLAKAFQNAVELEHATIPPYLTGLYSIKKGSNRHLARTLYDISVDEMLHMTIACNILNALGTTPCIARADFVPTYPTKLPMGINESFSVTLEAVSINQIKNVFMEIEEPENALDIPSRPALKSSIDSENYSTIGEFYTKLIDKVTSLGIDKLPGDPRKQVVSTRFNAEELFPIVTVHDLIKSIKVIIEQGEGNSSTPYDTANQLSHYYRFYEIYIGRKLVIDSNSPVGYSYSGDLIELDESNIYNIFPNTKIVHLPKSNERDLAVLFANSYTSLLKKLQHVFDGNANQLDETFHQMKELSDIAEQLVQTPFPGKGDYTIGPPFEYIL